MKKEIIIFKENLWQSIISDIFTFSILLVSFAINQHYIKSKILSFFLLIFWFIWLVGKSSTKKHTVIGKEKAIKYIKELKEQ